MGSFDEQMQAAQTRAGGLRGGAGNEQQPHPPELVGQALEELRTSLEELRVADEELRQQNEQLAEAREALEAERQRYQELFEFAPDAYLVTDIGGTIREANRAAAEILGLSANLLRGKPLITFVSVPQRAAFRSELARLRDVNVVREWEMPLKPRRGAPFAAAFTVATVRDRGDAPAALRWLLRDVSERKRAEQERLELAREQTARAEAEAAQQRLAFLAEASAMLSSSLDYGATLRSVAWLAVPRIADWCVVDVREEGGAIHRLAVAHVDPSKEGLARDLQQRYPPDPSGSHPIMRVLRTGKPVLAPRITDEELLGATHDPEHYRLVRELGFGSYMCVPLLARGRTLGALSLMSAGSARCYGPADLLLAEELAGRAALAVDNARLHREARENEERLRLLVEGATDHGMLLLDGEGRITSWNPGARHIFGYEEGEVLGQPSAILFTPEDRAAGVPEREVATARAAGRAEDQRWHVRRDGERFWTDGVLTALRDERGSPRGFGKVLRDATERKRAEEALAAAYRREHRIARTLQNSLLPGIPEDAFPGLAVAAVYQAALQEANVGGDFYDAFALGGGKVALVVGDASGKGLAAAARVAEVKYALRGFLREDPHPAEALCRVNDFLCDAKSLDERSGDAFVVLSLALVDPASGEAVLAAAGGEPPFVLRADGAADVAEAGGVLLGMFGQQQYTEESLCLAPGDTLLLFTDGFTEARNGGDFLGYEAVVRLAQQAQSSASVREMARAVLEGARTFAGGALHDDACLLLAGRR